MLDNILTRRYVGPLALFLPAHDACLSRGGLGIFSWILLVTTFSPPLCSTVRFVSLPNRVGAETHRLRRISPAKRGRPRMSPEKAFQRWVSKLTVSQISTKVFCTFCCCADGERLIDMRVACSSAPSCFSTARLRLRNTSTSFSQGLLPWRHKRRKNRSHQC